MIPSAANSDYPKFVADQVLTSDNLNDLFGYLDEQGRMTRTNLLGIGIVCGLKVKTAADGSSITITKGVGVTSSGYLVSVPEITYTKRTSAVFDAVKCEYYSRFVNIGTKTQKFDLWELKQEAEAEGTTQLTNNFLTDGDKVVLIFVELLEENNKNCDPNSCDDKGINVTVNFRPLLIEKSNVGALFNGAGADSNPWLSLPELSMKRFDVKATPLFECLNFFEAYQDILSKEFITSTQKNLTEAYQVLKSLLADEFPANPFSTLAGDFKFLFDGSIDSEQLIAIQYYYDLFSDILMAYNEFRKKGMDVIGMCCPDDIFPRHLLLDLAKPDTSAETSNFRHYFIPSPILCDQQKTVTRLKILFRKLVLLTQKFSVPPADIKGANKKEDANIRITPSKLNDVPFSTKSIPYYYGIGNAADALLKNWSPEKYMQGKSIRNLSYHAVKYNFVDEDIRQPLLYDLERYNFLRIEGHIGKPYQHVVKNITSIRDKNRLPFDIVALNADVTSVAAFIKNLSGLMATGNANTQASMEALMGMSCSFNDLELLYDSIMAELTGKLSNEMKFFYDLKRSSTRKNLGEPTSNIPQVPLLKKTDASFRFKANTIGHEFEIFYETIKNQPFISLPVFFQSANQSGNTDFTDFVFKAVLYYIEMLYETITTGLSNFSFFNFYQRYYTLIQTVRTIKLFATLELDQTKRREEETDHLDALLSITADNRMVQLYLEFLRRLMHVKIMQLAGYYVRSHPGIQHKAGVPMGGTFIIVYHETDKTETVAPPTTGATNIADNAAVKEATAFNIAAGNIRGDVAASTKMKLKEDATVSEHVAFMAEDIGEKVLVAKERIILGLEKSIKVAGVKVQNLKAETLKETEASGAAVIVTNATKAETEVATRKTDSVIGDFILEAATYLKNRKSNKLDEVIDDFDDGVVIADFYLPYTCCSDCPPVQMIVMGESEEPNQPPVARPGDNISIVLPTNTVTLDGSSSSDPDGKINAYLWEKKSGKAANIEKPNESKTDVSKLEEGEYVFTLTVTDDDGATDVGDVTVKVSSERNQPPKAVAFAKPEIAPFVNGVASAELFATRSVDPDGRVVAFGWKLLSGPSAVEIDSPEKETTKVKFSKEGDYVFELTVKDDIGATDTTKVTVVAKAIETANQPPRAKAAAIPDKVTLSVNNEAIVDLDGNGSVDPDGTIVSFKWEQSKGTTSGAGIKDPGKIFTTVQFSQPGDYGFRLTVTDNKGATNSMDVAVGVSSPTRVVAKTCAPLNDLITDFGKLSGSDTPANFKLFGTRYTDFRAITAFFKSMTDSKVATMSTANQVKFFVDQKIESQLPTWINNLRAFMTENSELRNLAILMFNIHTELAYYISCIQTDDIDKAEVKMMSAARSVVAVLKSVQTVLSTFTAAHKNALSLLVVATREEGARVKNNNEETVKANYVNVLKAILELLS